jgi:hypothetical protein
MKRFLIILLIALVCLSAGCWLCLCAPFGYEPLTTLKTLETQEKVFVNSKGEKLDFVVPDEVLTSIEGYKKTGLGKFYLYQITLDNQPVVVVCGNQLQANPTLKFSGLVVPRTTNQALDNVISEYEAQHQGVSFASRVILYQKSVFFVIGALLILFAVILVWMSFRKTQQTINSRNDYV